MRTIGISPKVLIPFITQLFALAATWVQSGSFDRLQAAQLVTAIGTAVIGYVVGPGDTEDPDLHAEIDDELEPSENLDAVALPGDHVDPAPASEITPTRPTA